MTAPDNARAKKRANMTKSATMTHPARIQYKPTQKATDAGIIAGVKNRTVLFNREVLTVLEGF